MLRICCVCIAWQGALPPLRIEIVHCKCGLEIVSNDRDNHLCCALNILAEWICAHYKCSYYAYLCWLECLPNVNRAGSTGTQTKQYSNSLGPRQQLTLKIVCFPVEFALFSIRKTTYMGKGVVISMVPLVFVLQTHSSQMLVF